jgi:ATP-dependent RNA helicase RhlE
MIQFSSLGLSHELLKAVKQQKYTEAFPIQQEAIPAIFRGRDILGIAPTGSGKTASFVLPLLQMLQGTETGKNRFIKVLVLVPTRELAVQIADVFQVFAKQLTKKNKIMAVYGGVSINPQMMNLQHTEVLVATPGRLLDLIAANAVHLSAVEALVLDEVDKMLTMDFKEEMTKIFALLPAKRQNILFSATDSEEVQAFVDTILFNPKKIEIQAETLSLDSITQTAYRTSLERKGVLLRYLIKESNWQQVLVFTSSIKKADNVAAKLVKNGINAKAFHSDKSQGARIEALNLFKSGKLRVLVATDLASRGIDIQFLPYVVNYELPRSPKDYLHRIGRTGRASAEGQAISLVSPDEEHHFQVIQKKMGKQIELIETDEINLNGY